MTHFPHDVNDIDRPELASYINQEIDFCGWVRDVKSPTPDDRFACLTKVEIAERTNELPFKDRQKLTFDHIWVNISEFNTRTTIGMHVTGSAEVMQYLRKNKSISYGLRFTQTVINEFDMADAMLKIIKEQRYESMSDKERIDLIDGLIEVFADRVLNGDVHLFNHSTDELITSLRSLKPKFCQVIGVYGPINREGRRESKRLRGHRPRLLKTKSTTGFA